MGGAVGGIISVRDYLMKHSEYYTVRDKLRDFRKDKAMYMSSLGNFHFYI